LENLSALLFVIVDAVGLAVAGTTLSLAELAAFEDSSMASVDVDAFSDSAAEAFSESAEAMTVVEAP
jgi:hypothetical protein